MAELQGKEDEMRQMFVLRVKEKEAELKENEKEVRLDKSLSMSNILFRKIVISAPKNFVLVPFNNEVHTRGEGVGSSAKELNFSAQKWTKERNFELIRWRRASKILKKMWTLLLNLWSQEGGSLTIFSIRLIYLVFLHRHIGLILQIAVRR